jgi:DegV family protein with EDD domain
MQIVTDSGANLLLPAEQMAELEFHRVPLKVTLSGKTYRDGIDIEPEAFYNLLEKSGDLPITSQPSAGEFAELYRKLAASDPEILSIHISTGLSGTYNAARSGAEMVPEAQVTLFDSKTLAAVTGWLVGAACRAAKAGWPKERILAWLQRIIEASDSIYTLNELRYLIHGGRISHLSGLIASALNIKPLIGVEKQAGTYVQLGRTRTFKRALDGLVELMAKAHKPGSALRVQVMHAFNPEGAAMLREIIDKTFQCDWLPVGPMSLVLGAHTGPSMVGVAYAPLEVFTEPPF